MTDSHTPHSGGFATDRRWFEHLCDHVLTRPESHDWRLVLPNPHLIDFADDRALRAVATELFADGPSDIGKQLLHLYRTAILHNIDNALRLGWWWEQGRGNYQEWCGLGPDGVFVVWDRQVIKSGWLPRSARWPPSDQPPRQQNPLPRHDLREVLRPPPRETPRSRYELFRTSLYEVSKMYEVAYYNNRVTQAGGSIFVDPQNAPRIGKWQKWLAERAGNLRDCEVSS